MRLVRFIPLLAAGFVLAGTVRAGFTAQEAAALAPAATFVVNSAADPGDGVCNAAGCTLREAISAANGRPGADSIVFDIPGSDVPSIALASPLPPLTDSVAIDGTTQRAGRVELNGANAGPLADGLRITSGGSTIRGLVINRFEGNGIYLFDTAATANVIQGNFIGTDATGMADMGNRGSGILILEAPANVIGGPTAAERNVISGNNGSGVYIYASGAAGNAIQGNFIGAQATGSPGLGNSLYGVLVLDASGNAIGGGGAGEGNLIAGNGMSGVYITSSSEEASGNRVQRNFIYANGQLGLDLAPQGPTANDPGDADAEANNLQNYPLLVVAEASAAGLTVRGTLNSRPGAVFTVEFFANAGCDASGYGEGQTFAAATTVTTDASGNVSFVALAPRLTGSRVLTATATDAAGNTSEFSPCLTLPSDRLFLPLLMQSYR